MSTMMMIVHCPPAGVDDDHEDKSDGGGQQGGEREESNCSGRVLSLLYEYWINFFNLVCLLTTRCQI